jgi:RND family efflux transporter MFP subunit
VNVAVSSEMKKGDLLVELDTGDLEYQLEQRKLALKKAEISYEIAKIQYQSGNAIDEYNLQLAEVDIQSIKLELEHLNQSLQEAKLYSPVDGIVTYVGDISPGDFVDAHYKFISISEPGDLLVEYKGDKASEFSLGDQVKLKIDNEQYDGEVVMVPSSVPFEEFEKYKNTLRIKAINLNKEIKMGTIVTINLILDESKDTLILPRNVIKTYDGKKYVYVLEDGVRAEKYIYTGIETNSYVEVTSGLKEGEEIISN